MKAAAVANRAWTRTTQLYDCRRDEVSLDRKDRYLISRTHQVICFTKSEDKASFFRHMRLLADDLNELSSAVGILIALSRKAKDEPLLLALNRNPTFWNSMLASLSTTAFIVMGRIHDNDKRAYIKSILKFLEERKYLLDLMSRSMIFTKTHSGLITKILKARHNIFGHSNFHRPVHVGSGIPGTWEEFMPYWRDLSDLAREIEERMFPSGTNYGPRLNTRLLDDDIAAANTFFDQFLAINRIIT